MMQNNPTLAKLGERFSKIFGPTFKFLGRWFFMLSIVTALVFCVFVWYKFVWKMEWSDEKKQSYISEKSRFLFNRTGYQEALNMIESRKEKFDNFPNYSGRDIFFTESF